MFKFDFEKLGFDNINFLKRHEGDENYTDRLLSECSNSEAKIKQDIEKVLCLLCNNTANLARTEYPGIDI
jgi:hypothetical protein